MKKLTKKRIMIPFIILMIASLAFYSFKANSDTKNTISYKSFLSEVGKGNIKDVYLSSKETIKARKTDNTVIYTENPRTENFKEFLLLNNIRVYEGEDTSPLEVIPLSVFFVLIVSSAIYILSKGTKKGSGAFKLSAIDVQPEKDSEINFQNVAGNEETKDSIKELVDFIKYPEKYNKINARMPRGIILYGPPGTGKTLMARALANEAGVPFFAVNGSDFVQIYVGVGAGRIRDLFKKAREKGKAVIFIDEIDAIGKKRNGRADGGSDERDQTLNALLAEMSGFKGNQGIVVLAATNRLDVLDEALLRPGRFDRHIEVGLPDVKARHDILSLHCKNKPLADDVDLDKLAQMTVYFSGAKLENLVNEAAIIAVNSNSEFITMEHLDKAYGVVLAGSEKKDRSSIKYEDKMITAYHEAGHALVSKIVSPENTVRKITIIPSTKGAGGYTLNIPPDRMFHTKLQLMNNIKVSLGGRAAEEIIFGMENITTGAYGDIESATNTLISMVKHYGMFEKTGLLNYDILERNSIANSPDILSLCSNTIKSLYDEVIELLVSNRDKLERLADLLLKQETIYDKELDRILSP